MLKLQIFALILVTVAVVGVAKGVIVSKEKCDPDRLAVYRIVLDTHWSKELFPKQYPEWRPPAQWSKLIGRSHDASFQLFREGEVASTGLQAFAETGRSDDLEAQSQKEDGVCDEFNGPAITRGEGRTETDFFIDGNHTKVSVAVRIVPSPDWFIGLDSVELCRDGFWIDIIAVQAGPMDAGTDDGYTFTAPNWPTEPRRRVSRITSRFPHHPANSFYYRDLDELPPIATFHLIKEKVYKLSSDQRRPSPLPPGLASSADTTESAHRQDISNDLAPNPPSSHEGRRRKGPKHHKKGGRHVAVPCLVSDWVPWSACSVSCGVGDQTRSRKVTRHARRGGRPCPPLTETRWCGEHTHCPQNFFNW